MTIKVAQPVSFHPSWKKTLLYAGLLAMGGSRLSHAADFPVTNLNDAGTGSLRAAITAANGNAGADTISFASGLTGSIQLTTGELAITESVTITGPGASALAVNGGGLSRHFNIASPANVTISGLKLQNGSASNAGGGSIITLTGTTLTLSSCVLTGNTATGSLSGSGGAIKNSGNATLNDCELTNNTAAYGGGAISSQSGSLTMNRCGVSGNRSNSIYSFAGGGGLELAGVNNKLVQCTISGNTCAYSGGGIAVTGTTVFTNCTIANNVAGPANASADGGGINGNFVEITMTNTIIAGNKKRPTNIVNDVDLAGQMPIFTGDHNLIGVNSAAFTNFTNGVMFNQVGTPANPIDPKLGPVQNNGGITSTQALLAGSPAVDTGTTTSLLTNDQRGAPFVRKVGSAVDIGAIEADFVAPTAALTPIANVTDASTANELLFTVVYTDESAVVRSSLGDTDIRVTGPNGFSTLATLVSTTPTGDAASISAVYRLVPPGGTWDVADNGIYSVLVEANQVFDGGSNPVAASTLGYIMVGLNGTGSGAAITATPTGGGTFNFALNFPNPPTIPLTITVDYGDGSTGALGSHTYAQAGTYNVTVTISGQGTPLVFTTSVSASLTGGGNFRVRVSKIRLETSGTDSITLTGVITVPSNISYAGKTVDFNVGGALQSFTLDAKGKQTTATGNVKFNLPKSNKKNAAAAQQILFKTTFTGSFAAAIKANTPVDTAGLPTTLPISVLFNTQNYRQSLNVKFKAGRTATTTRFGFF